jgi:hypothetical protein
MFLAALALGFTLPPREMSIRIRKIIFLGFRAMVVRMADKFIIICGLIV